MPVLFKCEANEAKGLGMGGWAQREYIGLKGGTAGSNNQHIRGCLKCAVDLCKKCADRGKMSVVVAKPFRHSFDKGRNLSLRSSTA